MSGSLLDTHVWLWFLGEDTRLPQGLRRTIEESPDECWFSPVSVWELGMLQRRGRIDLAPDLRTWLTDSLRSLPLREAPVNLSVALAANEVEQRVRDPADRFIAATAGVYELMLLTVDRRLKGLRGVRTRSR